MRFEANEVMLDDLDESLFKLLPPAFGSMAFSWILHLESMFKTLSYTVVLFLLTFVKFNE